MKIAEVLLLEAYFDELELAIKDRLAQYLGSDVNEIPTEEFRKSLSLDGFLLSFEELKSALEKMDLVTAIDKDSLTIKIENGPYIVFDLYDGTVDKITIVDGHQKD